MPCGRHAVEVVMLTRRLSALFAWLLVLALACWQLGFRTVVSSDMVAFLPTGGGGEFAELMAELRDGAGSRLLLAALEGGSPEVLAEASRELSARLRESGQFVDVFNGNPPMAESTRTVLFRYRYQLLPGIDACSFSPIALAEALEQRIREMSSSWPSASGATVSADPTAAFASLLAHWHASMGGSSLYRGVWLSRDRDAAFFLLRVAAGGTNLDAQERALNTLRRLFDGLNDGGDLRLIVSGAPALAVATRDRIRLEALWLSAAASGFILAFLWLAYRRIRVVLLILLPLASGALVAAAVVSALDGLLHGITIAFGITLLGVVVDYPVHLFSHRRASEPPIETMNRLWGTLCLGILTTALGYSAMVTSSITGLSQMGLFTCIGLLVAGATTRFVLPGLMHVRGVGSPDPRRIPVWLSREPPSALRWTGITVAAASAGVLLLTAQPWSSDLADLSPVPPHLAALDRDLRSRMGASDALVFAVVRGGDAEEVLARQESLAPLLRESVERGELGAFRMASQFVPSQGMQELRRRSLPDEDVLRGHLHQALQGLPFRATAFEPFLADVSRAGSLPPLSWDAFRDAGLGTPLDGLLHSVDEGWLGVVQLSGIAEPDALRARLTEFPDKKVRWLDLRRETSELVDRFREAAVERVGWAMLIVLLVLAVALRDRRRLVGVIMPVLAAVSVSAAMPLALGGRLTLFHILSLLLVVGITLDYGLFFSRRKLQADDRRSTLHAVVVCAVTTGTAFALLMLSSIPVLHAVGSIVATGAVAGFLFCWMFSRNSDAD